MRSEELNSAAYDLDGIPDPGAGPGDREACAARRRGQVEVALNRLTIAW